MNKTTLLGSALVISSILAPAQAEVIDQYTSSGQFGQAIAFHGGAAGWANATVSIEDAGINQTAHLFYVAYSPAIGYNYWSGAVPVEAVTVNGVAAISVDLDTCTVSARAGCGLINMTVNADEPASGWVDNGVRSYDYNGIIFREAGARQVRMSSATGNVLGVSLDTSRAFMGKYTNVDVTISTSAP